jgi:hypothetical protein
MSFHIIHMDPMSDVWVPQEHLMDQQCHTMAHFEVRLACLWQVSDGPTVPDHGRPWHTLSQQGWLHFGVCHLILAKIHTACSDTISAGAKLFHIIHMDPISDVRVPQEHLMDTSATPWHTLR